MTYAAVKVTLAGRAQTSADGRRGRESDSEWQWRPVVESGRQSPLADAEAGARAAVGEGQAERELPAVAGAEPETPTVVMSTVERGGACGGALSCSGGCEECLCTPSSGGETA